VNQKRCKDSYTFPTQEIMGTRISLMSLSLLHILFA